MAALLTFTSKGIFCEQGNFYIDPWKPVENAIITHAHADHSRPGHAHYLSHVHSVDIIKHRLGSVKVMGVEYGQSFSKNGVKVSLHPAGHILGSSQVRVSYKGEVWVASGDYKTGSDPVAASFEPVPCHTFITECTFGLPVFNWPEEHQVIKEIEQWWKDNQRSGKSSLLCAYALGKAQRILSLIDSSLGSIYVHGAVHATNEIYAKSGFLPKSFKYLDQNVSKSDLEGALVIAPPSAAGSAWANKLKPVSVGFASGWMLLRGSKRRRNVDRGFVLSDHADWAGLNDAVRETGAENIICTHGYSDQFANWLKYRGYNAYWEQTLFEGELLETKEDSE